MKRFISIIIISLLVIVSISAYSHGVNHEIFIKKQVGLKFSYDSSTPLVNADVRIFSPDNIEAPYMKLKTDSNGKVFFIPNKIGEWIVIAKDDTGHAKRVNIKINENFTLSKSVSGSLSMLQKIIIAVCVIWGAAGTALFFKAKKSK